MAKVYNISETPLHIRRSLFDLSYSKMFTAKFGLLYPCYLEELLPGDYVKVKNEVMVRAQPMVAPLMHAVHIDTHYFWVPYRILGQIVGASNPFITQITGFEQGVGYSDAQKVVEYNMVNFRVTPGDNLFDDTKVFSKEINDDEARNAQCKQTAAQAMAKNTLWDFFGFPVGSTSWARNQQGPLAFPWYAYNMVINEYYRDQNLNNPVFRNNNALITRAWDKDRFTSALPSSQRGTAPSLMATTTSEWIPMEQGSTPIEAGFSVGNAYQYFQPLQFDRGVKNSRTAMLFYSEGVPSTGNATSGNLIKDGEETYQAGRPYNGAEAKYDQFDDNGLYSPHDSTNDGARYGLFVNASLNINDLRLAMALQKWAEKTQRCGSRWTEFLRANYGTAPRDEVVQRPVYLGGSKQPLMISEVRATATTDVSGKSTIVGDMAGHGLSVGSNFIAKWKATEPGCIIGLLSIMPKSCYVSQGFNKKWLKLAREDWFNPMFCNLGEQPVLTQELFFEPDNASRTNNVVFGYQGIYDEYRSREDMIVGNMRDTFSYWHLGRSFANAPKLNPEFIACKPRYDVFAVNNEDPFIVDVHNIVKAIRPLPALSIPGGLD